MILDATCCRADAKPQRVARPKLAESRYYHRTTIVHRYYNKPSCTIIAVYRANYVVNIRLRSEIARTSCVAVYRGTSAAYVRYNNTLRAHYNIISQYTVLFLDFDYTYAPPPSSIAHTRYACTHVALPRPIVTPLCVFVYFAWYTLNTWLKITESFLINDVVVRWWLYLCCPLRAYYTKLLLYSVRPRISPCARFHPRRPSRVKAETVFTCLQGYPNPFWLTAS